jgi:hypothetical protein
LIILGKNAIIREIRRISVMFDIDEIWDLHKNYKNLKDIQVKEVLKKLTFIGLSTLIISFLNTNQSMIVLGVVMLTMMFSTLFLCLNIGEGTKLFNRKLKKKLNVKGWKKYFNYKIVYENNKLEEIINKMEKLESKYGMYYDKIFNEMTYESKKHLEIELWLMDIEINDKFKINNIEEKIKELSEEKNKEEIISRILEAIIKKMSVTDFFKEKEKIIKIIKKNIKKHEIKYLLAFLMKNKVEEMNKEKKVEDLFDDIENAQSINIKNKTKENFILKNI